MSEQERQAPATAPSHSLDELARLQGATVVDDIDELAADIWESDEELDAFLADLRAARHASLS